MGSQSCLLNSPNRFQRVSISLFFFSCLIFNQCWLKSSNSKTPEAKAQKKMMGWCGMIVGAGVCLCGGEVRRVFSMAKRRQSWRKVCYFRHALFSLPEIQFPVRMPILLLVMESCVNGCVCLCARKRSSFTRGHSSVSVPPPRPTPCPNHHLQVPFSYPSFPVSGSGGWR